MSKGNPTPGGGPIKAGDLVVVVKSHCGGGEALGMVRQVVEIYTGSSRCIKCGQRDIEVLASLGRDPADGLNWAMPPSFLKRIPPLDELEGEKHKEDLREPA